ncbi:MAG: hypothetical protein NTV73_10475 [Hyphomicrobiales bacterium]|nr:hypothetical protein [Hyphomicrobiales bacterium]
MAFAAAFNGSLAEAAVAAGTPKTIQVCHGYGCKFHSSLVLTASDGARFRSIMSAGAGSPEAERAALSRAVRYYEERTFAATGFRDLPKTQIGKPERGQMDCIDESTNTRALLLYLAERGLLRHHKVEHNVSRGFFLDKRYPHFTAVISDPAGVEWVVDSWYKPMGGAPDIMPLGQWKLRGQYDSEPLN